MIKFTQTRRDWDDLELVKRMLRAGEEGYRSLFYDVDFDDYFLISTATQKELNENFANDDLCDIFNELETIGEKESKIYKTSSDIEIELYWEIDRFSK